MKGEGGGGGGGQIKSFAFECYLQCSAMWVLCRFYQQPQEQCASRLQAGITHNIYCNHVPHSLAETITEQTSLGGIQRVRFQWRLNLVATTQRHEVQKNMSGALIW